MSKEDVIEIEGIVREAMPNAIFKVEMIKLDYRSIRGQDGSAVRFKETDPNEQRQADNFHPGLPQDGLYQF